MKISVAFFLVRNESICSTRGWGTARSRLWHVPPPPPPGILVSWGTSREQGSAARQACRALWCYNVWQRYVFNFTIPDNFAPSWHGPVNPGMRGISYLCIPLCRLNSLACPAWLACLRGIPESFKSLLEYSHILKNTGCEMYKTFVKQWEFGKVGIVKDMKNTHTRHWSTLRSVYGYMKE